jgi:glutathione S-transferase
MAISYSGIAVELREVILLEMPASLLACSPKATVPVLVLPDGQVLEESRDIVGWALAVNDPDRWQPDPGDTLYREGHAATVFSTGRHATHVQLRIMRSQDRKNPC